MMSYNSGNAPRSFVYHPVFQKIMVVALLLVGPVLLVTGSSMNAADRELVATGSRTTGTVVEVNDGAEASTHNFRVEYLAGDASSHSVWADWAPDEKPALGSSVTVIYSATEPSAAVVEGHGAPGRTVAGLGGLLTVVSVVIIVVMASGLARGRARRRRAD
ncbi:MULTISPECIES: DUF3592 domain-containing protein [unclassified Microbacterium]|uniref:DUF3592 domain-containing protein n=1 Tax=unclassified Microbacterium TaxID=2609290 RepID=UPI000EA92E15|nr:MULTISPECIES: DUF3592 domain-containing protein [unclassified Microbacterium]MBT2486206.1 DUF3592 domain-containing protein [Microbacterium sp. ISL-108]RKN68928.1 DUF3592 domain-containing protein [Microbacterium sp. CGR2]